MTKLINRTEKGAISETVEFLIENANTLHTLYWDKSREISGNGYSYMSDQIEDCTSLGKIAEAQKLIRQAIGVLESVPRK